MLAVSFIETQPVPIGTGVRACIPTSSGDTFVLYWVFPAISLAFITGLSVIKAAKHVNDASGAGASIADKVWQVAFTEYGQVFPICATGICVVQIVFYLVADEMKRAVSCATPRTG